MSTPEDPYAGQPAPEHGQSPQQPPTTPTPAQKPPYYGEPPQPYYYSAPPQKVPNRGVWFAIGAGSVIGLLALGFGSLILFAFVASDPSGEYYYVNQSSVVKAVEGPCEKLRATASEIQLFGDPKSASADIKGASLAVDGIVGAIDENNPNRDSRLWRDDWKALAEALDGYADDLDEVGAKAVFTSPTSDYETPIIARMSLSSDASCEVPEVIQAMDPELDDYYSEYY